MGMEHGDVDIMDLFRCLLMREESRMVYEDETKERLYRRIMEMIRSG